MRVAQFVINPDVLKLGHKMETTLFAEIFMKLPKDAKLIDIICPTYSNGAVYGVHFRIESSVFAEVANGGWVPDILATFRARPDGSVYLESVDYSAALDPSFKGNLPMAAAVAAVEKFKQPPPFKVQDIYDEVAPKIFCAHEMKEYVGVMNRFMYCTKCPYKENP